ncbi:MAG: type III-B CRISPR module RAMP protein Cmr6 [Gemmataceae bacterium]
MRTMLPQAQPNLDSHPGLLLQRYVSQRYISHSADGSELWQRAKSEIHHAAITAIPCELYQNALQRWRDSLPELTASIELQTPEKSRLIVGLGTENVLEAGITLHHTYGMPILPGSALKGLAAHYCDQIWGENEPKFKKPTPEDDKAYRQWINGRGPEPDQNYHRLLFGSTEDGGCLLFHDAWYIPDPKVIPLRLDVMTPHHPKWLDGSVAPTDFDSPIPVPFLSVTGKFLVAVSWCGPAAPIAQKWLEKSLECLRDALFHWGIGGKTSSGYGRFDEDKWKAEQSTKEKDEAKRQEAAKKTAALATMSPLERSIAEFLQARQSDKSPDSSKIVAALEKNQVWTDPNERIEIAKYVKEMLIAEGKWKDKDKDGKRKAIVQKILGEN